MTPTEYMIMAQQYRAPQGPLQVPTMGLLSVPDMSASYTDMSLSDEEVRKIAEKNGIINTGDPIDASVRMKVAVQRIKDIPGNIMDAPGNIAGTFGGIGSGLLDLFR